jgi:hypothetical protein
MRLRSAVVSVPGMLRYIGIRAQTLHQRFDSLPSAAQQGLVLIPNELGNGDGHCKNA